ncbi:MAG: nucleotidyltransferase domain-containing protein [Deltaproteobacteria bacterium]|jgi:predicted nucleotidyltransferase
MVERVTLVKKVFEGLVDDFPGLILAYVFGSQVKGEVGPLSDYDIAVLFEEHSAEGPLRSAVSSALAATLDKMVDVVLLNRVPIELAYAIIAEGVSVYERDPSSRIDYECKVMGLYGDYLPTLRSQRHDILNGDEYGIRVQRYREALGRTERALGEIRST